MYLTIQLFLERPEGIYADLQRPTIPCRFVNCGGGPWGEGLRWLCFWSGNYSRCSIKNGQYGHQEKSLVTHRPSELIVVVPYCLSVITALGSDMHVGIDGDYSLVLASSISW
jgi:hypothetical protein